MDQEATGVTSTSSKRKGLCRCCDKGYYEKAERSFVQNGLQIYYALR